MTHRTPRHLLLLPAAALVVACGGGGGGGTPAPATPVSVTVSPTTPALATDGTQAFNATVTGSSNTGVTWTIQEGAAGGTISPSGAYTAPAVVANGTGTFHIVATSQADPSKTATATVTVTAPALTAWTALPPMGQPRYGHTATLLPDGKVLVAGGAGDTPQAPATATAEIFNPATGTFTPTGSMSTIRAFHTAVLLPNGKVLISGGGINGFNPGTKKSQELYDPATETFTATGDMVSARSSHASVLLPNGKVLHVGSAGTAAELYDPATGQCASTGAMSQARWREWTNAVLLTSGKVLVVGGTEVSGIPNPTHIAEVYDPAAGTFSNSGALQANRALFQAQALPDGKAAVLNGSVYVGNQGTGSKTAEVWDPATGQFTTNAGTQARAGFFWCPSVMRADGVPMLGSGSSPTLLDTFSATLSAYAPAPTLPTGVPYFAAMVRLKGGKILICGGGAGGSASTGAFLLQ
ncbi:MAG: kelch repeat-containing protein [Holophagaceae bacterium]